MKNIFLTLILAVLIVSCENESETVRKYSKPYYLTRDYPVYLDASDILTDIQVKPVVNPETAFKIVSTDEYIFVGEMMKGVHVYEKTDAQHVNPLCFIECKFLKAFDVMDHNLYCNNFIDLLVIDVENPLQAKILHRETEYFNRYYHHDWNMVSINVSTRSDARLYEIARKTVILTGVETDADPPDFSEYDRLYGNIVVKEIPDTLKVDKPYVGFTRISDLMYTFGFDFLAFCSYNSSGFQLTQSVLGNMASISYYPAFKLHCEDGVLFALGNNYVHYFDYHNIQSQANTLNYWNGPLTDASYMDSQKTFWLLSENRISGGFTVDGQSISKSVNIPWVAAITCVGGHIITLGNGLEVYSAPSLGIVKKYPGISGSCMLKEGSTLITAGKQGVTFYDISNLNDIQLIP